jgi:hypothetical protein
MLGNIKEINSNQVLFIGLCEDRSKNYRLNSLKKKLADATQRE